MKNSRVAERYARAIIEIASDEKSLETVIADFSIIDAAIRSSNDLRNLLATPIVDERTKERILKEIFTGKISQTTERFMSLLTLKGRSNELAATVIAFQALLDEQRNVVPAQITTAVELTPDQKSQLESRIQQMSGRSVRADYRIDPEIIGGFRVRFEDTMIDASVRHQLERFHESLVDGAMA
jgi:F-type H+-transporting ATPase subunit delta